MTNSQDQRKMDWHLFWAAAGVVIALSTVIIGCYISISTRLTRIETVLIMQKLMPHDLAKEHIMNKEG